MPRKPSPPALTTAFLTLSALLSIAVLAVRNLYDDEISSFDVIVRPVSYILRRSAERDVHPPGMYLLAHFAYSILPSFRWMNLIPCLALYAGLAVFLFQVVPLLAHTRSQICLLLLATLHPQLLMWGNTFRWYSWWTGVALITLIAALQPRASRPTLGATRAFSIGFLLALLFYLNYITLLFAIALAAVMWLRFREQSRLLRPALLTMGVFLVLIAPQLHTMIAIHLPGSASQRSGLASSTLRLLESIAASEAYLPWHPLAILADLLFVALSIAGLIVLLRLYRGNRPSQHNACVSPLAAIAIFGLLFLLLVAISGLGGKPRNGLLLVPVLALFAALIVGTLRPRLQNVILFFLVLWSAVGFAHIVGRYGLTKSTMNARPEQVVAFIHQTAGSGCSVVVTYDAILAFSLNYADSPNLLIVSPFPEPTFGGLRHLPANCAGTQLYLVHSYLGGSGTWLNNLNDQLEVSARMIRGPSRTDFFSFDPDAGRKRSLSHLPVVGSDLAPAAQLPDYRYVVTSGPVDPASIDTMRQRMPSFISGSASNSGDSNGPPIPAH